MGYWGIPGWWKYNHEEVSPLINDGVPTASLWPLAWGEHPFGQDRIGRDLFAMTMRGAQQSITVMVVIGLIAGLIGVVVGALSGYFRGWTEAVLMRLTDVIIIIPALLLAAVMAQMAGRRDSGGWFAAFASSNGILALGIFLGLITWVGLARLMRGEFLSLREREFVDAARISGASNARIIFKHILPNAVGVLIVNVTLTMSAAILTETALSYLGVGVKAPDTSLGLLISQNQEAFATRPWLFWFPGLFIVLICLSINFIGDGLRDAFDPRQKKFNAKKAKDARHASARGDTRHRVRRNQGQLGDGHPQCLRGRLLGGDRPVAGRQQQYDGGGRRPAVGHLHRCGGGIAGGQRAAFHQVLPARPHQAGGLAGVRGLEVPGPHGLARTVRGCRQAPEVFRLGIAPAPDAGRRRGPGHVALAGRDQGEGKAGVDVHQRRPRHQDGPERVLQGHPAVVHHDGGHPEQQPAKERDQQQRGRAGQGRRAGGDRRDHNAQGGNGPGQPGEPGVRSGLEDFNGTGMRRRAHAPNNSVFRAAALIPGGPAARVEGKPHHD